MRFFLRLHQASLFIGFALSLVGFDLVLFLFFGFALVVGFTANATDLEVVEFATGATDHMSTAIGIGLDQHRLTFCAWAIRMD